MAWPIFPRQSAMHAGPLAEVKVRELVGKTVEVHAVDVVYTGRLVEIGEEEVYLESDEGWVVVPVDRVAFIREKDED